MGYAFEMRRRLMAGHLRALAGVWIAAGLLQASLVSLACLCLTNGQTSPMAAAAQAPDTGGDECCALCFCCHFAGVIDSKPSNTFLRPVGFLMPAISPAVPEPYRSPFDLRPRL